MAEPANDNVPSGFGGDLILELRPSPDELLRLALHDAIAERPYGPVSPADIDRATRRRIRFKDGRIDQWLGGDGRWHSAEPHYRHEHGKRRRSEADKQEDAARCLSLPATGQLPSTTFKATGRPCSYNVLLHRLGVSGFYNFDEAWANAGLYPACRVPRHMVGIARGVQFMAGRVRRNACASGSFVGPASGPEHALIAGLDLPRVAAALVHFPPLYLRHVSTFTCVQGAENVNIHT